jgi:hypothetical protein
MEHRLRVFENRVLRRIFGPKREKDGWRRKLHNDEFHNVYSSPRGWDMWHAWGRGEVFTGFWLGRSRHRWEDNIKMHIKEIGINGVNWIRLDQDRV